MAVEYLLTIAHCLSAVRHGTMMPQTLLRVAVTLTTSCDKRPVFLPLPLTLVSKSIDEVRQQPVQESNGKKRIGVRSKDKLLERTKAAVLKIQGVYGQVTRSYPRVSALGRCSRMKRTTAQQQRRDGRADEGGGLEIRSPSSHRVFSYLE